MTIRECLEKIGYDLSWQKDHSEASSNEFLLDSEMPESGIEIIEMIATREFGEKVLIVEVTNYHDAYGHFIALYLSPLQARGATDNGIAKRFRPVYPTDFERGG